MLVKIIRKYKKFSFAFPASFDGNKNDLILDANKILVIDEKNIKELLVNDNVMDVINNYIEKLKIT